MVVVTEETAVIRIELNQKAPDLAKVARSTGRLKKIVDWLAQKSDLAADEFAKALGKRAGELAGTAIIGAILLGTGLLPPLWNTIVLAAQWLWTVAMPF